MQMLLAKETEILSLVVLLFVIVFLVATFFILFYIYYKYYSKCIKNKLEDNTIKDSIVKENKRFFSLLKIAANEKFSAPEEANVTTSLKGYIKTKKAQRKTMKVISSIFVYLTYAILAVILAVAVYFKVQGNLFYINGKANLVIVSSSMQTVWQENTYIEANDLTNQISVNSLISLSQVNSPDEINLYDIVAFKDESGNIIVHRVIGIFNDTFGRRIFCCRGDANNASTEFEKTVRFSDIVGKFNGYQSQAFGYILTYLGSNIGIITIALAFLTIVLYEAFDNKLNKQINARKEALVDEIDEDIKEKIKNNEELKFSYAKTDVSKTDIAKAIKQTREIENNL